MRITGGALLVLLCAFPALAQQATNAKLPIEVTAQDSLEWNRTEQLYIARKSAIAKQGTTELHGDTLIAKYTDTPKDAATGKKGGTTISRIDADGNVLVVSDGSRATGDKGFYNVETGYSELTGNNLKIQTPTDTVTARDKLTYDSTKSEMNAYGNAKAVRGEDVITSDRLIGRFKKDVETGNSKLDQMEAIGNVVITTPTDVMRGDRGIYRAGSNIATITGNVRIDRGNNVITGARGEVDLNTNISRIFGGEQPVDSTASPASGGPDTRVRGVFYPGE
jgi:lipopolysaccharide export system protein LptA